ncbi:MAG: HAD hydrolase-like protein [Gemmatimonadales bacterium]|jgi:phosphoglycolate phosphatase-like HAD superfamily hydrolase
MNRAALLFDVDGTLADTLGAGKAALAAAMTEVCGETGPVEHYDFHGRTDPEIVRGLLRAAGWPDAEIDPTFAELWPAYLGRLRDELAARAGRARALAGVPALLDRLAGDERFACGLVTGNVEQGARLKLTAIGCADRFTFGAYGSDAEERDLLPAVALARAAERYGTPFDAGRSVVIGDTPADIRCARAAGTRVLAVATGRHRAEELAACGPDAVFADLGDADRVVEFLLDA